VEHDRVAGIETFMREETGEAAHGDIAVPCTTSNTERIEAHQKFPVTL
jgi:hypothetical protein